MTLPEARSVVQQLQQQLTRIQEALHINQPVDNLPGDATLESSPSDPILRMVGLTRAEEMDIRDPPGEEVDSLSVMNPSPHTLQRVTEVSERTKQHLVCSSHLWRTNNSVNWLIPLRYWR